MFNLRTNQSLSRRGSKLLVQAIIGIIGLFGVMFAQLELSSQHVNSNNLNHSESMVSNQMNKICAGIDWVELILK